MRTRHHARPGLTLLEIVLSMAILAFSMAAIFHLVNIGSSRSLDVLHQAKASLLCQSKLAEVTVGAESLTGGGTYNALADDPNWFWKLDATQADLDGLWNVKIWVKRDFPDLPPLEASISQMVLDPSRRGSTLDVVVTPSTTGQTTGTDSTTTTTPTTEGTAK